MMYRDPPTEILDDWALWGVMDERPSPAMFTPLLGGLTNLSYLINVKGRRFTLRVEGENSKELGIDRNVELSVHDALIHSGVTPNIVFHNPSKHYWIREYVDGHMPTKSNITLKQISSMVEVLSSVHQLDTRIQLPVISLKKRSFNLLSVLCQSGYLNKSQSHQINSILVGMPEFPTDGPCELDDLALCHMDPTLKNWIFSEDEKLWLIDWEYAGLGHPLWDIAVLVDEIPFERCIEDIVLSAYNKSFKHFSITELERAIKQIGVVSWLWYAIQSHLSPDDLVENFMELTWA